VTSLTALELEPISIASPVGHADAQDAFEEGDAVFLDAIDVLQPMTSLESL